jgi:hypothetical protein
MADLFGRERSVVTKHLRNVYSEHELDPVATCAKFAQVQTEGPRTVTRDVDNYNLDVIISVGYRVKSKRGTQFRIWATRTLRIICSGYTLNEKRLREKGLGGIEQAVGLLTLTLTQHALVTDEGRAVLDVVQQYTRAWRLLLEFDEGKLAGTQVHPLRPSADLSLEAARGAIAHLRESLAARGEAGDLFGQERSDQLHGILGAIEQTFAAKLSTPQCRHGPPTSYILSSKTTPSPTATNASARYSSSNICGAIAS